MRFVLILVLAQSAVVNSAAAQPAKALRLDSNRDPLPDGAIARLGTLRFQPPERFRSLALSPDGVIVAVAANSPKGGTQIDFMATSTGKTVRQYELSEVSPDGMQFSPDGKHLLFNSSAGSQLVDAATGKVVQSIKFEGASRYGIALAKDGKWAAAQLNKYVYDAPVSVVEVKTGKEVAALPGKGASCKELLFSPDNRYLLLCSMVPTQVTDTSMSFGPESKVAIACIDIGTRKIVGETKVGAAQLVALCPDGETAALEAANHQSVRVYHLPTGAERCVIAVKEPRFAFAPDGAVLFTIDGDGRGALWNATTGKKIRDLEGALANKDVSIVGIAKDGQTIAVLDGGWRSEPIVVVWNAATGKRVSQPAGHNATVTCIAYAAEAKLLVSGSLDRTVRLWNPATGEHIRTLTVHQEAITAVAISPDGKLLASSSSSGVMRLSHVTDGKFVAEFTGPNKGATALAFSPDGKVVFAGGHSPEVLGWEIAGAKEIMRFKTGTDGVVLALGDGGGLALTANGEEAPGRLQVWQPVGKRSVTSSSLRDEKGGRVRCDAALFSPDGRMFASSQVSEYQGIRPSFGAAQLRLWEKASGQPIRTLAPTITKLLAFSPNGRLLASGGPGRSGHLSVGYGSGIDIWDTITGEKLGALPVSPECIAFSPDGAHLATGGRDHGILIWEAPAIRAPKRAKGPSAAEREAWWAFLGGESKGAYEAIGEMIAAPDHTVAFLKERVRPVPSSDPDAVAKLIGQLDNVDFTEREKAQKALENMGEGAAHLLVKALNGNVTAEAQGRLAELLRKCEATSRRNIQQQRVVAVLEWIGTPTARAMLRTLADGAPRARLTIEARAALRRLQD